MMNESSMNNLTPAPDWTAGQLATPAGNVWRIKTRLSFRDRLGGWAVRWGIGRNRFRVPPGLYAAGSPSPESPVLVTANYKLSFDVLRTQLSGRDAWILILDTKGINVWCAAGKGTFSTDELIHRLDSVRLAEIITHRKLILPQLGATGVSAHEVRNRAGWRVRYGPVRADDLPAYLDSRGKASPPMRRVRFTLASRLILVPVELVGSFKYLALVMACFLLLSGLDAGGYSFDNIRSAGFRSVFLLLLAYLAGAAAAPLLLPWIPGAAFSLKGALLGLASISVIVVSRLSGVGDFANPLEMTGWMLLVPAVSSYLTMNFTGSSTYTSLSGVRREMRLAVPIQISAAALGTVLWIAGRFI